MKDTTNTERVRNINSLEENLWSIIVFGAHSFRKNLRTCVSSTLCENLQSVFHKFFLHLFLVSKQIIIKHFLNARLCERIKEMAMDDPLGPTNSFRRYNRHSETCEF